MVKIQRIKLQNYKSLRDLDFELHDLNILIGRNGSGKSNLLSFFRLLQSAANEQLSATINLMGGISEIRWKGAQRSESVSWRIIFSDLQEADSIYYIGDIVPRGNGFAISKEEITYPPHFGHGEDYKLLMAKPFPLGTI